MNALRIQILKHQAGFLRFYYNILDFHRLLPIASFATTLDVVDAFRGDSILQHRDGKNNIINKPQFSLQQISEQDSKLNDLVALPEVEFEKIIQELLCKNKDKLVEQIILQCLRIRRLMSDQLLKNMLKHYSNVGKPEMIVTIQKYFSRLLPNSYRRNGEFTHYLAKAQCLKGNSEKGLSILLESYSKNLNLRNFYRVIFRELINDSVMHRSEASLVVFKKYVLEFSRQWKDHYPLVCFWHICWLSSWYSDQMLSDELWETSEVLQDIVKEKVAALCISALRADCNEDAVVRLLQTLLKYKMMEEYASVLQVLFSYKCKVAALCISALRADCNEDAVVRLLQTLLKYKMMEEYASVLQVLFSYKLRNKDLRGCAEIIRNCDVLGITLPSEQQGKYISMLIHGQPSHKASVKPTKDFKLKF